LWHRRPEATAGSMLESPHETQRVSRAAAAQMASRVRASPARVMRGYACWERGAFIRDPDIEPPEVTQQGVGKSETGRGMPELQVNGRSCRSVQRAQPCVKPVFNRPFAEVRNAFRRVGVPF